MRFPAHIVIFEVVHLPVCFWQGEEGGGPVGAGDTGEAEAVLRASSHLWRRLAGGPRLRSSQGRLAGQGQPSLGSSQSLGVRGQHRRRGRRRLLGSEEWELDRRRAQHWLLPEADWVAGWGWLRVTGPRPRGSTPPGSPAGPPGERSGAWAGGHGLPGPRVYGRWLALLERPADAEDGHMVPRCGPEED